MLTKKQFLDRLSFLMEWSKKVDRFDQALKDFAKSDFTGYYDEGVHNHLLDTLVEDMEDDDGLISWWLYDCPQAGECPEHAKIWTEDEKQEWDVSTPEKLYDYIFLSKTQAPAKETLQMAIKAQDTGIKFALKTIQNLRKANSKARNEGWEDRDILLKLAQSKIENEYLYQTGANRDLHFDEPLHIISILEES